MLQFFSLFTPDCTLVVFSPTLSLISSVWASPLFSPSSTLTSCVCLIPVAVSAVIVAFPGPTTIAFTLFPMTESVKALVLIEFSSVFCSNITTFLLLVVQHTSVLSVIDKTEVSPPFSRVPLNAISGTASSATVTFL